MTPLRPVRASAASPAWIATCAPAAALQLCGAAGVVAVAVREEDQGKVLGRDLVPLERGQDGA
jgi:hypothetical protein